MAQLMYFCLQNTIIFWQNKLTAIYNVIKYCKIDSIFQISAQQFWLLFVKICIFVTVECAKLCVRCATLPLHVMCHAKFLMCQHATVWAHNNNTLPSLLKKMFSEVSLGVSWHIKNFGTQALWHVSCDGTLARKIIWHIWHAWHIIQQTCYSSC